MLRAKRASKSPYARPGRAQAAAKKAKPSTGSKPTSTVTQPVQVTSAASTVTQAIQVTPAAIPPALSNQPTTSSVIDIPGPSEMEASPTAFSAGTTVSLRAMKTVSVNVMRSSVSMTLSLWLVCGQ
ncbi:uncharacterized protein LOC134260667 [Saccostrea cucullata]|uniref:uncharacterized protein LOC134260667 n=1 Tax=Saccostrea cuccullata TaxID=36930 RepID=UPI002ED3837F